MEAIRTGCRHDGYRIDGGSNEGVHGSEPASGRSPENVQATSEASEEMKHQKIFQKIQKRGKWYDYKFLQEV